MIHRVLSLRIPPPSDGPRLPWDTELTLSFYHLTLDGIHLTYQIIVQISPKALQREGECFVLFDTKEWLFQSHCVMCLIISVTCITWPTKRDELRTFYISYNIFVIEIWMKGLTLTLVDKWKTLLKTSSGCLGGVYKSVGSQFARSWCQHSTMTLLWKNRCFIFSCVMVEQQWHRVSTS